jgi:hypothetical protein
MARPIRYMTLGLCLVLLSLLCGCGGGTSQSPIQSKAEPLVSVSLTEHSLTVSGGETHQFSATVTGSSNTNVIWSVSGCEDSTCGSISASGLYTAPSLVSTKTQVTIAATAQANPDKVDQAAVELMPITVTISPADAWVAAGGTQAFTASALYDSHHAGVAWALGSPCSDNCGTLSNVAPTSVTYTAPVNAPDFSSMMLTASSVSDPSKKAEITIALADADGMTEGDYAFAFNGWETTIIDGSCWLCEVRAAGRFHADAQGNITQGVEDINSMSGVTKALPFTGSYMLGVNGRGSFTFITAQGSATYNMVLDASRKKGKFISFDASDPNHLISGSGYFELQDKAAFSLAALAGSYAFGVVGSLYPNRWAAVGRFDTDASGKLTAGSADMAQQVHAGNQSQASFPNLQLTGLLGAPSTTSGRGIATLNWGSAYNFAYYVISEQKILLVQIDTRDSTIPVLSGEVRRQDGPFSATSFSTPAIFSMAGSDLSLCGFFVMTAIGQIIPDGGSSVTGIYDANWGIPSNQPFTGSYTVTPIGRSAVQLKTASGDDINHVAYLYSPNEAFLMQTSGADVLFGRLRQQSGGPFSEASLSGTYLTYTGPPAGDLTENDSGLTTFDGSGSLTATADVDSNGNLNHFDFYGTYTVEPNGRGEVIFSSPATGSGVFWIVSPDEIISSGGISGSYALLEYEK